jgi:hypothetical protein
MESRFDCHNIHVHPTAGRVLVIQKRSEHHSWNLVLDLRGRLYFNVCIDRLSFEAWLGES